MNKLIEKQAIKELVDTFSNLADVKDVVAQGPLFTEDAQVTTYIGGELFAKMHGREEIVKVFSDFLKNFHTVYHLNGQLSLDFVNDNLVNGINYCQVALVETQGAKDIIHTHYVRYQDTYVKINDKWLIKQRITNFMISDSRELSSVKCN